jgi:hypothetical protein
MTSQAQEFFNIPGIASDYGSNLFDSQPIVPTNESLNWYHCLSPDQKVYLKGEAFESACGLGWDVLGYFFTFRERIEMVYRKLVASGLINE